MVSLYSECTLTEVSSVLLHNVLISYSNLESMLQLRDYLTSTLNVYIIVAGTVNTVTVYPGLVEIHEFELNYLLVPI